jgi:hypothetical protein
MRSMASPDQKRDGEQPKIETDALTKAEAALQHFIKCVEVLPPDQAAPLWGEVQAKAAAILCAPMSAIGG